MIRRFKFTLALQAFTTLPFSNCWKWSKIWTEIKLDRGRHPSTEALRCARFLGYQEGEWK